MPASLRPLCYRVGNDWSEPGRYIGLEVNRCKWPHIRVWVQSAGKLLYPEHETLSAKPQALTRQGPPPDEDYARPCGGFVIASAN